MKPEQGETWQHRDEAHHVTIKRIMVELHFSLIWFVDQMTGDWDVMREEHFTEAYAYAGN
jgi:hypothetical protein